MSSLSIARLITHTPDEMSAWPRGSRHHERQNSGTADGLPPSTGPAVLDADVVVEGRAGRVTDPVAVGRAAKVWASGGWPAEPDASGSGITAPFNAPVQGPPPWNVNRIAPRSVVVALGTEPGGLTRFEL
jgi:hypothetical protein